MNPISFFARPFRLFRSLMKFDCGRPSFASSSYCCKNSSFSLSDQALQISKFLTIPAKSLAWTMMFVNRRVLLELILSIYCSNFFTNGKCCLISVFKTLFMNCLRNSLNILLLKEARKFFRGFLKISKDFEAW